MAENPPTKTKFWLRHWVDTGRPQAVIQGGSRHKYIKYLWDAVHLEDHPILIFGGHVKFGYFKPTN